MNKFTTYSKLVKVMSNPLLKKIGRFYKLSEKIKLDNDEYLEFEKLQDFLYELFCEE